MIERRAARRPRLIAAGDDGPPPVPALQVHHLGGRRPGCRREGPARRRQRGSGRGLREQVVVLANVLARGRFPGHPVRLRHRVHDGMVSTAIATVKGFTPRAALPQGGPGLAARRRRGR